MAGGGSGEGSGSNVTGYIIGCALATFGNFCIACSLNLQKYAHNKNQARPDGPLPYVKLKLWWLGNLLMVFGELGNFVAFAFAPTAVVSPMGAVSVVTSAIMATLLLKEPFRRRDLIGVILAIVGSVIIVVFAPTKDVEVTTSLFVEYLQATAFIVYIVLLSIAVVVVYFVTRMYGEKHVVWFLLLCSLLGSVTVLSSKGVSTFIKVSIAGDNQFAYPLVYVLLVVMGVTGFLQVKYLNNAMQVFGNTEVVPVYYVLFTISTITGGSILYQEWSEAKGWKVACFIPGVLITFFGVYLITSNRPKEVSDEDEDDITGLDDQDTDATLSVDEVVLVTPVDKRRRTSRSRRLSAVPSRVRSDSVGSSRSRSGSVSMRRRSRAPSHLSMSFASGSFGLASNLAHLLAGSGTPVTELEFAPTVIIDEGAEDTPLEIREKRARASGVEAGGSGSSGDDDDSTVSSVDDPTVHPRNRAGQRGSPALIHRPDTTTNSTTTSSSSPPATHSHLGGQEPPPPPVKE